MDFAQFAILLVAASACAFVVKFFRQPLLVGYIISGVILGLSGTIHNPESLHILSSVGVTLLLFLLGLEMDVKEIPSIGKVALVTGLGEIIITAIVGFGLTRILGIATIPALYIAVALTFSSTIIMVKLLSEKKDLQSLYGRIAVGYLLVQDVVAVLILMFLSGLKGGEVGAIGYAIISLKGVILLTLTILVSKYILPTLFEKYASQSAELLFITSIAWALGFAALAGSPVFGFTLEIGGLLAGLALSNLPEHLQIASRARPLRDFFLVIFFVLLGLQLSLYGNFLQVLFPAIVLSLYVLIVNPLIVMGILGFMGYRKRTSFMAGLVVAQISEFSLIMMTLGLSLGQVNQSHVSLVVLVGVITMTVSTYMILGSEKIYRFVIPFMNVFERKHPKEKVYSKETVLTDHIVLIGCDRTGNALISYFKVKQLPFLVVDFNPKVYQRLIADNVHAIFGDVNDTEILEAAHIESASAVISTIGNFSDNKTLLSYIKALKTRPITICTSTGKHEAVRLYEGGASYVLVPEVIAGDYIKNLLKTHGINKHKLQEAGKHHFNRLLTI
jgi:Kef-type K+ transport system membrane component KefB